MPNFIFIFIFTFISFTAKADNIKIEHIGPTLKNPWGMDFINDRELLVTEKRGRIFHINISDGSSFEIHNVPKVASTMQGGLLDIIHNDGTIFYCYSKDTSEGTVLAIDRAVIVDDKLEKQKTIFESNNPSWSSYHFGCRLEIIDSKLFATLGERGNRFNSQNPSIHAGSIIRINFDGSIPIDNPKIEGWAPENFSIGHRNPQGMKLNPETQEIWTHEHGPKGGDEINIIIAGDNYGWPLVSHGFEYGTEIKVSEFNSLKGFNDPEWVWLPSIAPSGMDFYPLEGNNELMFSKLKGNLLVGSLKFKRLYSISINEKGLPESESILIDGTLGRIRDVAVAKDGSILILNDESSLSKPEGGLYRIFK
ncbi:PQQ-dependent sugar dehydrogenase [Candidatus Thioglobus sp.]|nr:PQQ-dependent sugar dehydrogenase [Candidatus Thioglobus sp.]